MTHPGLFVCDRQSALDCLGRHDDTKIEGSGLNTQRLPDILDYNLLLISINIYKHSHIYTFHACMYT